jgi:predicted outer membrane repeat protein
VNNIATNGGGLGATNSGFTLIACSFSANVALQSGGAIATSGAASPTIASCVMQGNSAPAGGAVVVLNGASPTLSGCLMQGNSANQGGGLWWDFFTSGNVQSCTIVENTCTSAVSGALHLSAFASPTVTATIIAFTSGAAATFTSGGALPSWGCNDAFANTGGDVFSGGVDLGSNSFLDPVFCDAALGNWTLAGGSPCLAGGGGPRRGAFDLGCVAVSAPEPLAGLSWGRAKSLFR